MLWLLTERTSVKLKLLKSHLKKTGRKIEGEQEWENKAKYLDANIKNNMQMRRIVRTLTIKNYKSNKIYLFSSV